MQRLTHRLTIGSSSELLQLAGERFAKVGNVLRRADKTRLIIGLEIALTVTFAVTAGSLVWKAFEPPAWASAGEVYASAQPRRAVMPVILTEIDPFHRASVTISGHSAAAAQAPETMLNLQLFGIRAGRDAGPGSAIVATPDNVQGVFTVGQEIMSGVRLEQILPDRIVIRRNGVTETLSFDRTSTLQAVAVSLPAALSQAPSSTDEEPLRRLDVDMKTLASALRFTPIERGGARGLLLESSADPSVLDQSGLAPGDLLLSVNGTPIGDVAALTALAATGALRLTLEIERKGQRKFHRLAIDRTQ